MGSSQVGNLTPSGKKKGPCGPFHEREMFIDGVNSRVLYVTRGALEDMTTEALMASLEEHKRQNNESAYIWSHMQRLAQSVVGDPTLHLIGLREFETCVAGLDLTQAKSMVDGLRRLRDALEFEHTRLEDAIRIATRRIDDLHKGVGIGSIYVIKFDRWIKIGRAFNVEQRMANIKLPIDPEVVAEFRVYDYKLVESRIHKMLSDKRVRGEWFELADGDVERIRQLAEEYAATEVLA